MIRPKVINPVKQLKCFSDIADVERFPIFEFNDENQWMKLKKKVQDKHNIIITTDMYGQKGNKYYVRFRIKTENNKPDWGVFTQFVKLCEYLDKKTDNNIKDTTQ